MQRWGRNDTQTIGRQAEKTVTEKVESKLNRTKTKTDDQAKDDEIGRLKEKIATIEDENNRLAEDLENC